MANGEIGKTVVLVAHGSGMAAYDALWRERVLKHLGEEFPRVRFHMGVLNGELEAWEAFPKDVRGGWAVMPLVLSDGVVTRVQLPSALSEYGRRLGCVPDVEMLPLPGVRTELDGAVRRVLEGWRELGGAECGRKGVLVIQHGSMRHPVRSGEAMARRWAEVYPEYGGFYAGYLSQEPGMDAVLAEIPEKEVVVVNWFLNCGNHVMEGIPSLLGLKDVGVCGKDVFGWRNAGDKRIFYTTPVGESPEFMKAVTGVVRDWLAGSGGEV